MNKGLFRMKWYGFLGENIAFLSIFQCTIFESVLCEVKVISQ